MMETSGDLEKKLVIQEEKNVQNGDESLHDENVKKLKQKLIEKEDRRRVKIEAKQNKSEHKLQERNIRKNQRNAYKLEKLRIREFHIKSKEQITNKSKHFRWYHFFTKWFLIGLVLVVISLCIPLFYNGDNETIKSICSVAAGLFSSVGIALFVGCVFDFSKNSEAFMGFISKLLSEIIVSKTFLASLAADDKKEALKLILQPSNKQIEQYSNINEFFKKKIDDYMTMFDTNFKTNIVLNIEARKSVE